MNYDPKIKGWHLFSQTNDKDGGGLSGTVGSEEKVRFSSPSISDSIVQNCAALARNAADDMAQGFILSAERLQKLRSSLHCD